jgi:hypothetical protein
VRETKTRPLALIRSSSQRVTTSERGRNATIDRSAPRAPLDPAPLLVWAVLDLYITRAKNGVRFSQLERQHLRRMRHAGSQRTTDQEVNAA